MISILIVDDNSPKVNEIEKLIESEAANTDLKIEKAESILEAKKMMSSYKFDLLILDIRLPIRKGDEPLNDGGITILREISLNSDDFSPIHVIGLTAYDKTLYESEFSRNSWYLIHYNPQLDEWKDILRNRIKYLVKLENESNFENYDYDIAIVTALRDPELDAVLNLNLIWKEFYIENDDIIYNKCIIEKKNRKIKIVAATANSMGLTSASLLTAKMILHFKPRYLFMLGISCGIKDKCNYGDVLITSYTWEYDAGKVKRSDSGKEIFENDYLTLCVESKFKGIFNKLIADGKYVNEIQNSWKSETVLHKLEAHFGPFPSGSRVVANKSIIDNIITQQRKVIGFDMETYAVFFTCQNFILPRPTVFSIKSVQDFGDSKDDKFRNYAAYTSAHYFLKFAQDYLLNES